MDRKNSRVLKNQEENLELFTLIWLDADVSSTAENVETASKLRRIINFIKLFDNLKTEQNNFKESKINLYRGQIMSLTEVEKMKTSIGQLISMNSFFSTSLNRDVALQFVKLISKFSGNMQSVLFEIEANTDLKETKPFALIKHLSYYEKEDEVLFMLGLIFRLVCVEFDDKENVWRIELVLQSENDYELKNVLNYKKEDMEDKTSLLSLGRLLSDMGKLNQAQKYFYCVIDDLLEVGDRQIAFCYYELGNIARAKGNYDDALFLFQVVLDLKSKYFAINSASMAATYSSIGSTYMCKCEYELALENYTRCLQIFLATKGPK
ncbi:unnamed protein product [Didymodactylos carnosus]|uniref:Tetratricopeptide repeat protein n=1 Tax=Didymodactylos carnosus TaxID=1234261 RepID=A0A815ESK2_9BILA|nr:unnamed protein product [Didymodactylos carnosus]CAF4147163.1 unnamed protein product [Didymodactylos carnosus]